jgi:hypothetical protein
MPGEDHKPAGDLAAVGSASSAASTGVFSAVLDRQRTWSSIDGVWLTAYFPQCPNAAVRVDLWSNYGGSVGWQIDDRCFTYNASPNDPTSGNAYANQAFCLFRSPRPVGFPGTSQLLRLWSIKSDCKTYADDAGAMRFSDYNPGAVADTHTYRALVDNERVVVTKASYQIVFDRRTGVPYEYYSLRSGQRPLRNTLHANAGSATQFSLSDFSRVMDSPCRGTYPWWNPVQAGSYCGCNAGYCNYPHNRPSATRQLCDLIPGGLRPRGRTVYVLHLLFAAGAGHRTRRTQTTGARNSTMERCRERSYCAGYSILLSFRPVTDDTTASMIPTSSCCSTTQVATTGDLGRAVKEHDPVGELLVWLVQRLQQLQTERIGVARRDDRSCRVRPNPSVTAAASKGTQSLAVLALCSSTCCQ